MCDGDGEQLPLARLPEVVVHEVEVDGGREVSQDQVLGVLQQDRFVKL